MSCNKDAFLQEEKIIRDTYYADKDDFMNIIFYRGDYGQTKLNGDILECISSDDLEHTFDKTIEVFQYVTENIDYDFIVRVNTTEILNLYLIRQFIDTLCVDDMSLYCDNLIWRQTNDLLYAQGNFMIMSKYIINEILKYSPLYLLMTNEIRIDDIYIGYCLKHLGMQYLKSINKGQYFNDMQYNIHQYTLAVRCKCYVTRDAHYRRMHNAYKILKSMQTFNIPSVHNNIVYYYQLDRNNKKQKIIMLYDMFRKKVMREFNYI